MENGNWKIETRNSKTEIRKPSPCLPLSLAQNQPSPLGRACRAACAFFSRSATGLRPPTRRQKAALGRRAKGCGRSGRAARYDPPPIALAKGGPQAGEGSRPGLKHGSGQGLLQARTKLENGNWELETGKSKMETGKSEGGVADNLSLLGPCLKARKFRFVFAKCGVLCSFLRVSALSCCSFWVCFSFVLHTPSFVFNKLVASNV